VRVIAGSAKGRTLRAAPGRKVRPTSDRVREALFSILGSRFDLEGATLADLFAGTGALGIEALSRGAGRVVFVESDREALRVLSSNLRALGFADRAEVLATPVEHALCLLARRRARFDGMLLDPPYRQGLLEAALTSLARLDLLTPGGWVMAEAHVETPLAEEYGVLRLTAVRRYGKTALALFVARPSTGRTSVS
jgi:16S rRNA (guanine(966)-N(2))-methyltransferase RsmD